MAGTEVAARGSRTAESLRAASLAAHHPRHPRRSSSSASWSSARTRTLTLDPAEGGYSAEAWRDFIVQGAAQGAIFAMIALGYSLVYGILRMINFAHGEVFMAGAFGSFFFADAFRRAVSSTGTPSSRSRS